MLFSFINIDDVIVCGALLSSVVGHAEPQHACDGHHSRALSARQPRVLVHQKPGESRRQESPVGLGNVALIRPCLITALFRVARS